MRGQNSRVLRGDCRELMRGLPAESIDAIVTDPPYELGFMGKSWDSAGVSFDPATWAEALRVLKPGGHLLAFGGSRTYHRIAVAIEDAGFEIRDSLMWIYGSGFPKSLNVGKAIEAQQIAGTSSPSGQRRAAMGDDYEPTPLAGTPGYGRTGNFSNKDTGSKELTLTTDEAKRWEGWGTALKPAHEPIVLARKPLIGTVAENVLAHGTGALNIDASRIATTDRFGGGAKGSSGFAAGYEGDGWVPGSEAGRWPANVLFDEEAAALLDASTPAQPSRFFYVAKPSRSERNAGLNGFVEKRPDERTEKAMGTFDEKGVAKQSNYHPTVKPIALMRYLIRLVTPPGGTVLDPFLGSGTTACAATLEGFDCIGIEMNDDYADIAEARIKHWKKEAE